MKNRNWIGLTLTLVVSWVSAGEPANPEHMPNVPMPKFNFFMPKQSIPQLPVHHKQYRHHVVHAHVAQSHLAKKPRQLKHHQPKQVVAHAHHQHHTPKHHKIVWEHADIRPGSLKQNILRLSRAYGWSQVIWQTPNDYQWVGRVRVTAHSYPGILKQVLQEYPLQANFYQGNHILVIQPRTLRS